MISRLMKHYLVLFREKGKFDPPFQFELVSPKFPDVEKVKEDIEKQFGREVEILSVGMEQECWAEISPEKIDYEVVTKEVNKDTNINSETL